MKSQWLAWFARRRYSSAGLQPEGAKGGGVAEFSWMKQCPASPRLHPMCLSSDSSPALTFAIVIRREMLNYGDPLSLLMTSPCPSSPDSGYLWLCCHICHFWPVRRHLSVWGELQSTFWVLASFEWRDGKHFLSSHLLLATYSSSRSDELRVSTSKPLLASLLVGPSSLLPSVRPLLRPGNPGQVSRSEPRHTLGTSRWPVLSPDLLPSRCQTNKEQQPEAPERPSFARGQDKN